MGNYTKRNKESWYPFTDLLFLAYNWQDQFTYLKYKDDSYGVVIVETFDFQPSIRLIFGQNQIDQLGQLAKSLAKPKNVLLVTDSGVVAAGKRVNDESWA